MTKPKAAKTTASPDISTSLTMSIIYRSKYRRKYTICRKRSRGRIVMNKALICLLCILTRHPSCHDSATILFLENTMVFFSCIVIRGNTRADWIKAHQCIMHETAPKLFSIHDILYSCQHISDCLVECCIKGYGGVRMTLVPEWF